MQHNVSEALGNVRWRAAYPRRRRRCKRHQIADYAAQFPNRIVVLLHVLGLGQSCFAGAVGSALSEFGQELSRPHKEGVPLQNAAKNHHRVRPQYVHCDPSAKLGAIVRSYDRIFVFRQNKVQSRLIFHQVIDARKVFERPLHMGNQARQRIAFGWSR
jgi:hypothetical protein